MNNFTVIFEASRKYDSETLLSTEITSFINKVNKVIPTIVKDVIHLTQKYNLLDRASIDEIKSSSKGSLKRLAQKYNISETNIEDLWKMLKELKSNIYLLPQYMSPQEREMLELGKLSMNDLTIDLESSQGRNAATKMYMPMIYKIVSQYVGKSKLAKTDLISVALEGFTLAMNDWDRSKNVPFKTYAGTRVKQAILNEINSNSHELSGFNDYALKKGYNADALSLDSMLQTDDNGDYKQDRIAALGTTDDETTVLDDSQLKLIYDLLEKKFNQRDIVIFYRFFGLNGYQKVKSKDLAKEFGWSEGNIRNSVINKIIKYLRTNPKAQEILSQLHESYNISLMIGLVGMDKEFILETLCNDDMFILLEELNRWGDKNIFRSALEQALINLPQRDQDYILNVLDNDFDFLDGSFKKYKKIIILFLSYMYPTETISRKSDVSLLDYMIELQDAYKKYKK